MSLKPQWWCIKGNCKHYNTHAVHKGALRVTEHCKHENAIEHKDCETSTLGLDLTKMEMCPILYDMGLSDD